MSSGFWGPENTKKIYYNMGTTGAAAAANMFVAAARNYKRQRLNAKGTAFTSTNEKRPENHVGGPSGMRHKNTKTVLRNKRALNKKQYQHMVLQNLTESYIHRWQLIQSEANPYSSNPERNPTWNIPSSTFTKYWTDETKTRQALPIFAFNLTTMGAVPGIASTKTIPMYRLYLNNDTTTSKSTPQYVWSNPTTAAEQIFGQNKNNVASQCWELEYSSSNPVTPRTHNNYLLDYCDIKLCLTSQSKVPIKFRVSTVSFNNPYAGPRRYIQRSDGTIAAWDASEGISTSAAGNDQQVQTCAADLWWDNYLAPKLVHPIRTVQKMYNSTAVTFHKTECCCLEPQESSASADTKTTLKKDIYIPFKQAIKCTSAPQGEVLETANINASVNTTAGNMSSMKPVWNFLDKQLMQSGLPAREQDVWLLIQADNFDAPIVLSSLLGPQIPAYFDIVVKQKVTCSIL